MPSNSDRRRIMRIQLGSSIVASIGGTPVTLLDVSASGARIQHAFPLVRGSNVDVTFEFDGTSVLFTCSVIRCKLERHGGHASYCSGLRFLDGDESAADMLHEIIARAVVRDFDARKEHLARTHR